MPVASHELGSVRGPIASRSPIAATLGRNTDPHQKCWSKAPPTSGPIAAPAAKELIQIPIAVVRCRSSLNIEVISASDDGASDAPAIPSSALAAISIPALVENAAASEPTANAAPPVSSSRR